MPLRETIPEGGVIAGESLWKRQILGRAQRVNGRLWNIVSDDFTNNATVATATVGTGTVAFDTGLSGGVARIKTGVVLGSYAVVYNSGGAILIGDPSAESWYAETRCWIRDQPLVDTEFVCISVQDSLGGGAEAVSLGLFGSIDTTFVTLSMTGAGTTNTTTQLAADFTGFHTFGIGYDLDNDKIFSMVDGDVILELDGPFANLTAQPCFLYAAAIATTAIGGQDVELWTDYLAAVVGEAE